jgi:class 3 adenylate cyclase
MPDDGLDTDLFNRLLMEATGVGLALVEEASRRTVFHNRRLAEWFPVLDTAPSTPVASLLPGIAEADLAAALAASGSFAAELSVTPKRRPIALLLRVQVERRNDATFWVLEVMNNSKVKELEYLIQSYSAMIEKQNRTLAREKERAEKLLLNIMPKAIYEELKTFGVTTPQRYAEASVLMLDFVGFSERSIATDAAELVAELNDLFTNFDRIAEQFGCERIKTIGDAYMAVSGVPEPSAEHAHNAARTALLIRRYLGERNRTTRQKWECRIGIGTGPVIGSVVGIHKYVYDIFGVSVNLAARCEARSGPMEITISAATAELVEDTFRVEPIGEVELKGFGRQPLFRLLGTGGVVETRLAPPLFD